MDQPGLDPELHREALRGLSRINLATGAAIHLWREIREHAAAKENPGLKVLDMACGGGAVAIGVRKRALREKLPMAVEGCDMSPVALEFARGRAVRANVNVRFFRTNLLDEPLPEGYDVLVCSLFLHHLDEDVAVDFLRRAAAAAGSMVLVNDLVRSTVGYLYAYTGCHLLTRSPIVRTDGPISAKAAFKPSELEQLAHQAGLGGAEVKRHWPEQMLLVWKRD